MRVTIYSHEGMAEAHLPKSDTHKKGKIFKSKKTEKPEDFAARVIDYVQNELLEDAEIETITTKKFSRLGGDKLQNLLCDTKGLYRAILVSVMNKKGVPVQEVAAPEKPPRKIIQRLSLEECQETAEEWKALKGSVVNFTEFQGTEQVSGIVKSAGVDKRVPMVLVAITLESGRVVRKAPANIEIDKEASAKNLEAIAAEKQAKEDAIQKEKDEKAAAKAAKAEAAAKKVEAAKAAKAEAAKAKAAKN